MNARLIIDPSHKPWLLSTATVGMLATVGYVWADRTTPGGLTGGSTVGLWYGIAGTGLMIFAGLLSALRLRPSWRLGSRSTWLKGHIWLGLLSGVLILCHSGFHWGGVLERILGAVFGLVLATGVCGLLLQQFLPRIITARVPSEAPYEQIPHICEVMRNRANSLVDNACGPLDANPLHAADPSPGRDPVAAQLRSFYESEMEPFLGRSRQPAALLANPGQAASAFGRLRSLAKSETTKNVLVELEGLCEQRRQLAEQERLHHWLHSWLLLHIPLSVMLLFLGVLHVVTALYH